MAAPHAEPLWSRFQGSITALRQLRSHAFFRKPISAWLIAFGGTAIGIWLELASQHISSTTGEFARTLWEREFAQPVVWDTVSFWIACIAWATVVYFRLSSDDHVSEARIVSLIRAINRAPDASVVYNYPVSYFQPTLEALGPFKIADASQEALEAKITAALRKIAEMARDFARQPEATYGAHIMLALRPVEFELIDMDKELKFQDPRQLGSLKAMLYLRSRLCVTSCDAQPKIPRTVHVIALPVPELPEWNGRQLAIPGAPRVLLTGRPGVHGDARRLHEDCGDLAGPIRDEIREYYSDQGAGKDTLSFASFRLEIRETPIGVLNIDANVTGILGTEDAYYSTFHALLSPLIAALAVNVQEYASMDLASLKAELVKRREGAKTPDTDQSVDPVTVGKTRGGQPGKC